MREPVRSCPKHILFLFFLYPCPPCLTEYVLACSFVYLFSPPWGVFNTDDDRILIPAQIGKLMAHISAHIAAYAGAAADDAVMPVHLQPSKYTAIANWAAAATRTGWQIVPTPITICGPPQGATITFLNSPTVNMQNFYLFKRFTRAHPWTNYKVALSVHHAGYKHVK